MSHPATRPHALSPLRVFRTVAVLEAITWALLLIGMALKYLTRTTDLGVTIAGPIHGVAFIAYCLVAVAVAVDQRWSLRRTVVGLLAAVPPFTTILFDVLTERHGLLGARWRLRDRRAVRGFERPVAWVVRNPLRGATAGLGALVVLTGAALLAGPPV